MNVRLHCNNELNKKRLDDFLQRKANGDANRLARYYEFLHGRFTYRANELKALQFLPHLQLAPHQRRAVELSLFHHGGRSILADEVGLGKTIEAGCIAKELLVRELVKRVLIIAPTSLLAQWQLELFTHFNLSFTILTKKSGATSDLLIASYEMARRQLQTSTFDLLIADEAHRLKNRQTKNFAFVQSLRTPFRLLLTATPLHNNERELFSLLSLVNEERFANDDDCRKETMDSLFASVIIRQRREDIRASETMRHVRQIDIIHSDTEEQLYHKLATIQRRGSFLTLLQREFTSHPFVAAASLTAQLGEHPFIHELLTCRASSKLTALSELLRTIEEPVIIFTEFRTTQRLIQWQLAKLGRPCLLYNGSVKKNQRQWYIEQFRQQQAILVATDAGSEGLNLQFCRTMIHFDLPWNPMKLEQRIGRIDRIGQQRETHIYYLITKHTIEERIYDLLQQKVATIEQWIGQLRTLFATQQEWKETEDVMKWIQ